MGLITIDYHDRKLIYEQLIDNIKGLILRGDLKKNDYLPSVRSLAKELGINPNTIQKAYNELEREGIIVSLAGRGSLILQGKEEANNLGREMLCERMMPLVSMACSLGMSAADFAEAAEACYRKYAANTKDTGDAE